MTQRKKLELQVNRPTEIELLYDECVSGQNQYGAYFLYAVKCNGQEYSFFPPESLHKELDQYRRGDRVLITRLSAFRGDKLVSTYDTQAVGTAQSNDKPKAEARDDLSGVMLQCYKDAININSQINGLGDIDKIAVTLYISRSKR
ncbi:MAG: hypothetical protein SCALA702_06320 [Melioribacteraceae bacterium]|nr:MAG: hypothetical protein SCALA702_06320 [Melioribacteraceae bacterium]